MGLKGLRKSTQMQQPSYATSVPLVSCALHSVMSTRPRSTAKPLSTMPPMTDRPSTIPPGLRVELSRHQVVPGQSAKVDEWMKMLNDRADECRATLDPERVAVEAIFRLRDDHRRKCHPCLG